MTRRTALLPALAATFLGAASVAAFAHASERGHVLLLPTGHYFAGGAAAVVLSFLALAVLPPAPLDRAARCRIVLVSGAPRGRTLVSLLSFLVLALLVTAGLTGSRDPLSNPLPLVVWTLLWAGLTLASGVFGNVWAWLNPWYGPWRLLASLSGRDAGKPPLTLPEWVGQWPAVVLFFGFAWFELVDVAPEDPARLAALVACYWLFTFAGIAVFGYRAWTERVEFLTIFLGALARLSPLEARRDGKTACLALRLPGAKAADAPPWAAGGVAFLLLALSSVSFDGFMRTFTWLGWIGVNPLEFPGRSALVGADTAGLLLMFLILAAVFLLAVGLGERIARGDAPFRSAGMLIWSILPIALAYHFAHYLTALLVNGQYLAVALSDPFGRGWNLFGTAEAHVHAGVVLGAESAWTLWNCQAAAIVAGHVVGVALAHLIAYRIHGSARKAALSQIPLAVLMVGYTVFGLWLLATPSAG